MTFQTPDFAPAAPEIFLLSSTCVMLLLDLFLTEEQRDITYRWSIATLLGALVLTLVSYGDTVITFNGLFISDTKSDIMKIFIYIISIAVFVYSKNYLIARNLFKGEYFILSLFGILGMMVMVSGHSMLTLYLGLELMSLCLYAMVALDRDSRIASEAAMKYFILGALASGMLLYGMSMIYGVTATLNISKIAQYLDSHTTNNIILVFGLVFVLIGLAFKLGVAPFHMWVPDVYQGAPTAVTIYLSAAPKIAAFAMLLRLLIEGLSALNDEWQMMLTLLAFLSMGIGNIVAIAQTNLKRMLAYSTIANAGFILLGVLAGTAESYAAAMLYTLVYAMTALGAFGIILLLSRCGFEADNLVDLKGLNQRSPWFAFIMLIIMFSMAGVPPTIGFFAKFAILKALVDVEMYWLAIAAVIFSIIGAFYYLRIIWHMYFENAEDKSDFDCTQEMKVMLSINGLLLLALGLFPSTLISLCLSAF